MSYDDEMGDVLADVRRERFKQINKWGVQRHFDIDMSAGIGRKLIADLKRRECDSEAKAGRVTWEHIIDEELAEAMEQAAAGNRNKLREELVQCAAVLVAWIEDIDSRGDK